MVDDEISTETEWKEKLSDLPGVAQLDSNFYIDMGEITNFNWWEYRSWLAEIYGKNSDEYISSLPDTNVWKEYDPKYHSLSKHYYTHRAYIDYPLVGVTCEQALSYSKWRTNVVFEILLRTNGILNPEDYKGQDFFTIDKFYSDPRYSGYHAMPYPKYELVNSSDWDYIIEKADSLNALNIKKCRQRSIWYAMGTKPVYCDELIINGELCVNIENDNVDPTVPSICYTCKRPVIFNLIGNVREITVDRKSIGGGWADDQSESIAKDKRNFNEPNAYCGFRNMCSWQKFK